MSKRNFWDWRPQLANAGTIATTGPTPNGLLITDTSVAGTPTYLYKDGAEGGEITIDFDAQNEAQNVCLSMGNILAWDIDKIVEAYFRFAMHQAALDAATMFALGLSGDRNDAIDSIAQAALLRIIGADSTTAVVVETDDGTTDNNDVATGKSIADTDPHELIISFANGKSDVRFFLDGQPLAQGTTFDMSAYSGSLQFFGQIQKTADTNVDGWSLLDACVRGRRTLVA